MQSLNDCREVKGLHGRGEKGKGGGEKAAYAIPPNPPSAARALRSLFAFAAALRALTFSLSFGT